MAKYDALRDHLESSASPHVMTFDEVDHLVGGLPPSARRWAAWWANDPTHVQARAWLEVGRRVDTVDLGAGWVTFSDGDR